MNKQVDNIAPWYLFKGVTRKEVGLFDACIKPQ